MRHGGWVNDATFSPDGRQILTTSDDGTARVWSVATGEPLTGPLRLGGGVWNPAFSRDGKQVLAGNGLFAQVWDVASGLPLTPLLRSSAPGLQVAFSSDDKRVLSVAADRSLESFDLTPLDWPLEDFAAAARLLSSRELDATDALVPLEQALEPGARRGAHGLPTAGATPKPAVATDDTAGTGPTRARALLRRDWERLRSRLALAAESASTNRQFNWHAAQATAAEGGQQWFAAAFHVGRLSATHPDDEILRQRLTRARAQSGGELAVRCAWWMASSS